MVEELVEAEAVEERENRPLVATAAKVVILEEGAKIETENIDFTLSQNIFILLLYFHIPAGYYQSITYLTITRTVNKFLSQECQTRSCPSFARSLVHLRIKER